MKNKLTAKEYKKLVDTQGKTVADSVASVLGIAQSRVGKLDFAPVEVVEKWNEFCNVVDDNLDEWNESLPSGSTISKVSLNCNK